MSKTSTFKTKSYNFNDFVKKFENIDYSLNLDRTEKDYQEAQKEVTLFLATSGGTANEHLKMAIVNGREAGIDGNMRTYAIVNSPVQVDKSDVYDESDQLIDENFHVVKKVKEDTNKVLFFLSLEKCTFEVDEYGEMSLEDFQASAEIRNTKTDVTRLGRFRRFEYLYKKNPLLKEKYLMARFKLSKGAVQEIFKAVKLAVKRPEIKEMFFKGELSAGGINKLYSSSIDEKQTDNDFQKVIEEIKAGKPVKKGMKRKNVEDLLEVVPTELKPLLEYILEIKPELPDYQGYFDKAREAGIVLQEVK